MISFFKFIYTHYSKSRVSLYALAILIIVTASALILSAIQGIIGYVGYCVMTLVMFCLPPIFEKLLKVDLPPAFEIIVMSFIFSANILGDILAFYIKFPWWDTMLHVVFGFAATALGFSLIDLMHEDKSLKFKLNPLYLCGNAFGFTMAFSVFWEFFERSMDKYAGKDMQKDTVVNSFQSSLFDMSHKNIPIPIDEIHEVSINGEVIPFDGYVDIGLIDTMTDLLVAVIGALIFCVILYKFLKTKGNNKFAAAFIPVSYDWAKDKNLSDGSKK